MSAALVAVLGQIYVQPFLENWLGLEDTSSPLALPLPPAPAKLP
jgi:hypothetical protein